MRFMRTEVSFYFLRQERKRAKYIERALEARLTKLEKIQDISVPSCVTCELVDQPLAKAERLTECQINSNVRNVPELVLHTRSLESERVVLSVPCEDVSNKTMVKEDQIEQLMDSSLVKSLKSQTEVPLGAGRMEYDEEFRDLEAASISRDVRLPSWYEDEDLLKAREILDEFGYDDIFNRWDTHAYDDHLFELVSAWHHLRRKKRRDAEMERRMCLQQCACGEMVEAHKTWPGGHHERCGEPEADASAFFALFSN